MTKLRIIKENFFNNRKIAENYFFMTFLQTANMLIALLLYPYLIRMLGKEAYGTYVFVLSNIQIFNLVVAFGFDTTLLKQISMNNDNAEIKSQTFSEIFMARIWLFFLCGIIFAALFCIPFVQKNAILYIIVFSTTLITILFPLTYFQALQKTKHATYINVTTRVLTIPLIFMFVKSPADLLLYALIVSILPLCGAFYAFFYIQFFDKITVRFISPGKLKPVFKESLPFFATNALDRIKQESVTFIVGTFLGMGSVALWDLAHKIVLLPKNFINSINASIFPEVINTLTEEKVRKIFRFNTIIGISITILVALCSYFAVLVLGGKQMLAAYPLVIILSTTIYTALLVDCYFNFVFVPQNRYYLATKNQLVSLLSFLVLAAIGIVFFHNVVFFVVAFTVSCWVEIVYCRLSPLNPPQGGLERLS